MLSPVFLVQDNISRECHTHTRRKKTSILAFHLLRRKYNDKVNKRMTENSPIFNYELAKVGKVP